MNNYPVWYAIEFYGDETGTAAEKLNHFTEALAMCGYTYNTDCEDVLFVIADEVDKVERMLKIRGKDDYEFI